MRRLLRVSPLLLALLAPVPAVAENTPVADAVEAPAPALPEPSKPGPEPLKPLGGTSAARLDERLVDDAPPPLDDGGSLLGSLLRMVLVLGLVVGLIYLSLNVVGKRLLALQPTGNPLLKVHDRFALEPKKSLYVVEAAGEYLLLGVGEREISLVTRLETERVQALLQARTAQRAQLKPFWERLTVKPPERPRASGPDHASSVPADPGTARDS